MYVCMYVCMYVLTHECMYVYANVYSQPKRDYRLCMQDIYTVNLQHN